MSKSFEKAESLIDLIDDAVVAKKEVGQLLQKEQDLTEVMCLALDGNQEELLKALRAASYHETHQSEKTPQLQSVKLVGGLVKLLRFIECDNLFQSMLDDAGISITINPGREYVARDIEPADIKFLKSKYGETGLDFDDLKTIKDLAFAIFYESIDRRLDICQQMKVRKEAKKTIMKELEVLPQEYSRLHSLADLVSRNNDKAEIAAQNQRASINTSLSNFNTGLRAISKRHTKVPTK